MEENSCLYFTKQEDPSRTLQKILVLLKHQIIKEDVNRQLKIINQYLTRSEEGFLVRDLSYVMHLFELVRERVLTEQVFAEPLNKLLDICLKPLVLTRVMEQIAFEMDIEEYFSWLGYMIVWLTNKEHQMKIIKAIYKLTTRGTCECTKRNYLSLEVRLNKARTSRLPDILGDILDLVEDDIYLEIVKIIQVLIEGSKKTCITLLRKNVVSAIIVRLEPTWKQRFPLTKPELPKGNEEVHFTGIIFCVLNALLVHANANTMRAPSKFTLWSLQWAFRLFALKEISVDRNNVLAVLLLLMEIYPDLLIGNLTFSYDIAMLAMSRDIVFHPNWTSNIKLTTSHEDHSCMALLLMSISYFPNCLSGPKVIEECRVVIGLLKLINNQQTIKWHQLQSCYLIRLSLNILHKIVPASTEEFIEDGGPLTILQLLNRSLEDKTLYSDDIIIRSVELLALLAYDFKSIRDSVAYNGGVACILNICSDLMEAECIWAEAQVLLAVSITLLEHICTIDDSFTVLPLIINYMRRYVNPNKQELILQPEVIILCFSFIWNKIIPSYIDAMEFIKMGGLYLMLDIIQMGCLPIKLVGLGAIIDLCDKVECIPYLVTWRRNGQGIKGLLMEIFRLENQQLAVKTNKDGLITDYCYPLMGETQFYETYCMCQKHLGNASIGDMFISCRPKVYCLLQILNEKQNQTVEIANEFYKVSDEELPVKDQVTYVLANNYLALKLGENWKEVKQEFEKMNLEPVPSDKATLDSMIEITDKWTKDLQKAQQEILKKQHFKQRQKEEDFYATLRTSRLAEAWESLREIKYIAHCSERMFRVTSSFKLQAQIFSSLKVQDTDGELHRTFRSNIPITTVCNQSITIPNDMQQDLSNATKPIFVSPISSSISTPRITDEPAGEYLPESTY